MTDYMDSILLNFTTLNGGGKNRLTSFDLPDFNRKGGRYE